MEGKNVAQVCDLLFSLSQSTAPVGNMLAPRPWLHLLQSCLWPNSGQVQELCPQAHLTSPCGILLKAAGTKFDLIPGLEKNLRETVFPAQSKAPDNYTKQGLNKITYNKASRNLNLASLAVEFGLRGVSLIEISSTYF